MIRFVVVTFVALTLTTVANANAPEIVLQNGERHIARLLGIADGKLTINSDESSEQTLAPEQWMRWNHPADPALRPTVHFGGSSQLLAKQDWTGKVPIEISSDEVIINHHALGKVSLNRRDVRCVLVATAREPDTAQRLLAEADRLADGDRVWLTNGDLLQGRIVSFDGTRLDLELAGELTPILAKRIAGIAFVDRTDSTQTKDTRFLAGFDDGSIVEVANVRLEDGQLTLTRDDTTQWTTFDDSQFVFLQSLAPSIVYLSDMEPVNFKHTPYFSGAWPLAQDRGLDGNALSTGGCRYAKGIAMHSASRVVYQVPDGATKFLATIGLDDSAGDQGSVVFRLYRLTASGLEPAYESPVVRGGTPPQPVSVDLAGATAVVLVVDYADRGDELDRANWLDARFVRE